MTDEQQTTRTRVRELRLRRFRAIENARLELNDFTVIIGRNGAGKSTTLEAFDFMQDALSYSLVTAMERRGGVGALIHRPSDRVYRPHNAENNADDSPIGFEIAIDLALPTTNAIYGFSVTRTDENRAGFKVVREVLKTYPKHFSFSRVGDDIRSDVAISHLPVVNPESLILPIVADQDRVWNDVYRFLREVQVYDLSPQLMQAEPRIGSQHALAKDGSNIGDAIKRLEEDVAAMTWIVKHLESVTPGISEIHAGASAGRRTLSFCQGNGEAINTFSASEMSNGTLHSLGVLVALRQNPAPSLVFIDEIEASIHTAALSALMDAAKISSQDRCQVVITSHSTDALSHPAVSPENVRIVDWHSDRSQIFRINQATRDSIKPPETVGRLLRSNALWQQENPEVIKNDIFEVQRDVEQ
jgi:predicted ATPase